MSRSLFLFVVLLAVPAVGQSLEYEIGEYQVNLTVLADGDYRVEERIEYRVLSGTMSRANRFIPMQHLSGVSDVSVTAAETQLDSVQLDRRGDRLEVAWQFPERAADLTVRLRYRAEGALQAADGENRVDWPALGRDWSVPVRDLRARIRLPGEWIESADHLETTPAATPTREGEYSQMSWTFGQVSAGESRRVRVRFPQVITPTEAASASSSPAPLVIGLLVLAGLAILAVAGWAMYRHHRRIREAARSTPPDGLEPATGVALLSEDRRYRGSPHPAVLIHLAEQGYLELQPTEGGWFRSASLRAERGERPAPELPEPERALVEAVAGKELGRETRKAFKAWEKTHSEAIRDRLVAAGWLVARRERRRRALWLVGASLLVGLAVVGEAAVSGFDGAAAVAALVVGIPAALCVFVGLIVASQRYELSEDGRAQRLAIKGWLHYLGKALDPRREGVAAALRVMAEYPGWVVLTDSSGQRLTRLEKALRRLDPTDRASVDGLTPPRGLRTPLSEAEREKYGDAVAVALAAISALQETRSAAVVAVGAAGVATGAGGAGGGGAAGGGGGGAG